MNKLSTSPQLLSEAEKQKYEKFRLPLIPCPSCGETHKGSLLNLGFNRECVSCGNSMELGEISNEGIKSLEYVQLNVEKYEDQEIIAKFRDNILWMCDHCGKGNLNLKKNKRGGATSGKNTNCGGCGTEYDAETCLKPFLPLKDFGFDDGDDSNNDYELTLLFKTQGLWFQCIRKAIDNGGNDELQSLFSGLKNKKSITQKINARLYDGYSAIQYMMEYLGIKEDKAVIESITYAANRKSTLSQESFKNIQSTKNSITEIISFNPKIVIPVSLAAIIGTLAVLEKTESIEIEGAYHESSVLFQEKGTLQKSYRLERHDPKLTIFDTVDYDINSDTTGRQEYGEYLERSDFYRLRKVGNEKLINGPSVELDTGDDRRIETSYYCPGEGESSSSSSSGSNWGGGSSSSSGSSSGSSGSSGVGFGSGGSLFMGPEGIEVEGKIVKPEGEVEEKTFLSSLPETIISILSMSSSANADTCIDVSYEDITISAEIQYLIQNYTVWDWKKGSRKKSGKQSGIDYHSTLEDLTSKYIQDPQNEKISREQTEMFLKIQDDEGKEKFVKYDNEGSWIDAGKKSGTNCSVTQSYLQSIFGGIQQDDIEKQCL